MVNLKTSHKEAMLS